MNWSFGRIVFVTVVLFTVYLFVATHMKANLDVNELQNLIITKRIMNSPNSITYTDPITLRTYPGIIDLNRFNTDTIERLFESESINLAAKLELSYLENKPAHELYLNQEWYERWAPLTSFEKYDKMITKRYVLIKDGNEFQRGLLRMHVVISNE